LDGLSKTTKNLRIVIPAEIRTDYIRIYSYTAKATRSIHQAKPQETEQK
jgi:hypothetical protein